MVDRCRLHGSLEKWGMVEPRQSEAPTPLPAAERRTVWQRHRALVNREARGALAELLGALGVIVTLVYLAVPIRQNAASNRKGALQNVTTQDADFLAVVSGNSALADIFLRGSVRFEALTPEERFRFAFLLAQSCRTDETRLQLYIDGAVPDAIWQALAVSAGRSSARPPSRQPGRVTREALGRTNETPAGLSSRRTQSGSRECLRHVDTVGVVGVVPEWAASLETVAFVKGSRRCELAHRASLQLQRVVAPSGRLPLDVLEHSGTDPLPPMRFGGAHGFHLAGPGFELLQGTAPHQVVALPHRPERDLGRAQRGQVQGMHALERCDGLHMVEVSP